MLSHAVQQETSHFKYRSDTLMHTSLKKNTVQKFDHLLSLIRYCFFFFCRKPLRYKLFRFFVTYIHTTFYYTTFKRSCTSSLSLPYVLFLLQDKHSIYLTSPSTFSSNRSSLCTGVSNRRHMMYIQFISWQGAAGMLLK